MPKYSSPLEPSTSYHREEHDRINAALWREQELFMARLQARRDERASLETGAAHRIQAVYRGHAGRRRWSAGAEKRLQMRKRIRSQLRGALGQTGWVLSAAEFKEATQSRRQTSARTIQCSMRSVKARSTVQSRRDARRTHQEEFSARVIQNSARRTTARAAARQEAAWAREDKQRRACEVIQRQVRRHLACHKVSLRRAVLRHLAATMIQSSMRQRRARRRVLERRPV